MSVYTCDVCGKSTIIDTTGTIPYTGCLLTAHCSGRLHVDRNPPAKNSTPSVNRYALDVILQPLLSRIWRGNFNVSVQPTVLVYKQTGSGTHIQITKGFTVDVDTNNRLVITFDEPTAGIAHIITHSSYRTPDRTAIQAIHEQLTYNGVLTIAVPEHVTTPSDVTMTVINPSTNTEQQTTLNMTAHRSPFGISLFNTAWKTVDTVLIEGAIHRLYSCTVPTKVQLYNGSYELNSAYTILLSKDPYSELVDTDRKSYIPSGSYSGSMTRTELFIDSTQKSLYNIPIKITSLIF